MSVILQVGYFKVSGGQRLFRMSPIHHHFELGGWDEEKITIRFWIVGILAIVLIVGGPRINNAFAKELGAAVKPIAVNTDLLQGLDQTKRLEFLKQWQAALGRK